MTAKTRKTPAVTKTTTEASSQTIAQTVAQTAAKAVKKAVTKSKPAETGEENLPATSVALPATPSAEELHRLISQRAYERFLQRGYSNGNAVEDWLLAEQEVLETVYAPAPAVAEAPAPAPPKRTARAKTAASTPKRTASAPRRKSSPEATHG